MKEYYTANSHHNIYTFLFERLAECFHLELGYGRVTVSNFHHVCGHHCYALGHTAASLAACHAIRNWNKMANEERCAL